jgi:hypothetical protein
VPFEARREPSRTKSEHSFCFGAIFGAARCGWPRGAPCCVRTPAALVRLLIGLFEQGDHDEVRSDVKESQNRSLEDLQSANAPDARSVVTELDEADILDEGLTPKAAKSSPTSSSCR